jgi:hypothetical protein
LTLGKSGHKRLKAQKKRRVKWLDFSYPDIQFVVFPKNSNSIKQPWPAAKVANFPRFMTHLKQIRSRNCAFKNVKIQFELGKMVPHSALGRILFIGSEKVNLLNESNL